MYTLLVGCKFWHLTCWYPDPSLHCGKFPRYTYITDTLDGGWEI